MFETGLDFDLFLKAFAVCSRCLAGESDDLAGGGDLLLEVDCAIYTVGEARSEIRLRGTENETYTLNPPPPIAVISLKPCTMG